MTVSERKHELVWAGRHLSNLLSRLATTVQNWATEVEADPATSPFTESPLSTHAASLSRSDLPSPTTTAANVDPPVVSPHLDRANLSNHTRNTDRVTISQRHPLIRDRSIALDDTQRPRKKRRDYRVAREVAVAPTPDILASDPSAPSAPSVPSVPPASSAPSAPSLTPVSDKKISVNRRIRVNWSDEENNILCTAVSRNAWMSEDDLVNEIVKALNGSRTKFQTKGRFRNLLASGKVRASDTKPRIWVVHAESTRKTAKIEARKKNSHNAVATPVSTATYDEDTKHAQVQADDKQHQTPQDCDEDEDMNVAL